MQQFELKQPEKLLQSIDQWGMGMYRPWCNFGNALILFQMAKNEFVKGTTLSHK